MMRGLSRAGAIVLCLAVTVACAAGADEAPRRSGGASCVDAVLGKARCSNPDEVCRILLGARDPNAGSNLDSIFEFRTQALGDGTDAYVFSHRPGSDPYTYLPNFHFVRSDGKLVLLFDGRGVPATYLTDRPRVNGRYQLERVSRADIPGFYRKREAERWFWTGKEYARAFSRVTIAEASDPKLDGTETSWNPETETLYREAGPSWTYKVQSGDTLSGIARRYGATIDEIMRQNDIANPSSLRLGQTIRFEGWKLNAR